jgi:hypothetical protein
LFRDSTKTYSGICYQEVVILPQDAGDLYSSTHSFPNST